MAILKDDWQLYNSLTLCDDSKKGVRTELPALKPLRSLQPRHVLRPSGKNSPLRPKTPSPSCSRRNLRHEDNAFIRQAYGLRAALFFPAHRMYAQLLSLSASAEIPLQAPSRGNDTDLPSLEENERAHILEALRLTGGRLSGPRGAAALLKVPRSTLQHRIRKLGIVV